VRVAIFRLAARVYLWLARRLYNEFAWLYDLVSWLVSAGRWAAWRGLALGYVAGPRVLEVGFGTGELLLAMARNPRLDPFGVDLSRAMHRVTSAKLRSRGLDVPRARARTEALPFADGCFDTVVSTFPAEYILDLDSLRELARVLGPPGGRLVVVGLTVYPWAAREMPGYWLEGVGPAGERPVPMADRAVERLRAALTEAGLVVALSSRYDGSTRVPVVVATSPNGS